MKRLLLVFLLGTPLAAGAQTPTISASPDLYNGQTDDDLVLTNVGTEPISLDSLRFASSLDEMSHGLGWYLRYTAYAGGEQETGDIVCNPSPYLGCDDSGPLWEISLAPADSVVLDTLLLFCAVCRTASTALGDYDDTLLVYAGGASEPLRVAINDGRVIVSSETSPEARDGRVEVYPSPALGRATVRAYFSEAGTAEVRVFDIRGRLVAGPITQAVRAGEEHVSLSLTGLTAGSYHVELRSASLTGSEDRLMGRFVVLD